MLAQVRTDRSRMENDAHHEGARWYERGMQFHRQERYEDAIDGSWIEGAALYTGGPGSTKTIEDDADVAAALGSYDRFGDWLDYFREVLRRESWHAVVGRGSSGWGRSRCSRRNR